jgi:hypothetical protein
MAGMNEPKITSSVSYTASGTDADAAKYPNRHPIIYLRQELDACKAELARLRSEPRWISVTERLPEPGLRVLAYYRILDADGTPAFSGYDGNGGCIAQDYLSRLGDADDPMEWAMRASDPEQWPAGYVTTPYTHWMPLPEPPAQ